MNKEIIKKTREFLKRNASLIEKVPFAYINREHGIASFIFEKSLDEIYIEFFSSYNQQQASRRYREFLETLIFWGILPIEYEDMNYTDVVKIDRGILQEDINVQKSDFKNLGEYVSKRWVDILSRNHSKKMFWRKVNTAYHAYIFKEDKVNYNKKMIHPGFDEWQGKKTNGISKYNAIIQHLFLGTWRNGKKSFSKKKLISKILVANNYRGYFYAYSGDCITTDWFYLKNNEDLILRMESWEFVSGHKDEQSLRLALKEFDSPEAFLYSQKNIIISNWLSGMNNSKFITPIMSDLVQKLEKNEISIYNDVIKFLEYKSTKREFKEKNKTLTEMEQRIASYRADFKIKMGELYGDENFIKYSEYKRLDSAHIVEVKTVKGNPQKIEWIFNTNNGINIEPNIHRMWDRYDIYLDTDYHFKEYTTNEVLWTIKEEFHSNERTTFIRIRKEIDFKNKHKNIFTQQST